MKKANATGCFDPGIITKQDHLNGICMDFLHDNQAPSGSPSGGETQTQPSLIGETEKRIKPLESGASVLDGLPTGKVGMGRASYVELQITTNFSFLRGASHPDEL